MLGGKAPGTGATLTAVATCSVEFILNAPFLSVQRQEDKPRGNYLIRKSI
jgi:hypothetical protein